LRQAATRPAGTAISEASATATSTMTALTWKRSQISGSTGKPLVVETPRSPPSAWRSQTRYCSGSGWSRPIWRRIDSSWAGSAPSPSISSTGSPGISRISAKTAMETSSSVGIVIAIRRRR